MKMLAYRFIFSLFVYFISSASLVAAEIESIEDAIRIAGNQRMLTQKMLKDYSLIGVNIRARKARQDLEQASQLFNQQLAQLEGFVKDDHIKQPLMTVKKLWTDVKTIYHADVERDKLIKLTSDSELLLKACQKIVQGLEKQAANDKAILLNITTKEQMLAQRIISLLALKAWQFEEPYSAEYQKTIKEFEQGLATLEKNSTNTTEIVAQLTRVGEQFKRLISTMAVSEGGYSLAIASTSGEKIATQMQAVTQQYQNLLIP